MIRARGVGATADESRWVIYERTGGRRNRRNKPKKRSPGLAGLEEVIHQVARADQAFSDRYLTEHERSNAKKRDGWLRDLNDNLWHATKDGRKKFKLKKIIGL